MKHKPSPLTDKQRVEFAKQIEYFFEASRANWSKVLGFAFVKGIAMGLGVFVGGTIIVAILLWILSGLGHIPFLNSISDVVEQTVNQGGR